MRGAYALLNIWLWVSPAAIVRLWLLQGGAITVGMQGGAGGALTMTDCTFTSNTVVRRSPLCATTPVYACYRIVREPNE